MSYQLQQSNDSKYPLHLSKMRYWIIVIFSLNQAFLGVALIVFHAAPQSTCDYYPGITMKDLNLSVSIGSAVFLVCIVLMMVLQTRFNSLRAMTLISTMTLALSSIIRLIPTWFSLLRPKAFAFILTQCILTQIGGAFTYSLPSEVSATWFRASEREFITGILSQQSPLGIALAFLVIPYITQRGQHLDVVLYIIFIAQLLITILIIAYFPSKPLIPPSFSEQYKREEINFINENKNENHKLNQQTLSELHQPLSSNSPQMNKDLLNTHFQIQSNSNRIKQEFHSCSSLLSTLKCLFRPRMIIFLVVCGLQSGVSQAWNGNITYLLTEIGINETIGGIGSFFAIVLAAVGGILSSFIVQRILIRKEKLIVGILYIIQDILMVFAVLMLPFPGEISSINGEENINHKVIIQAPTAILVILTILAGSFGGTPFPLYFEMVAELGFPHVSESISAGALAFVNMLTYSIVLFIFSQLNVKYFTILTLLIFVIATILLPIVRITYGRLEIEEAKREQYKQASEQINQ